MVGGEVMACAVALVKSVETVIDRHTAYRKYVGIISVSIVYSEYIVL